MARIGNNTNHSLKFHQHKIEIAPYGWAEIDSKTWKTFKKNSRVKELIKREEIVVLSEESGFWKKFLNYFKLYQ